MQTRKTLVAFSTIVFSLVTGSAVAGPDWSTIERARTAKQAEQAESKSGMEASSKRAYFYGPRAPYPPPQRLTPQVDKSEPALEVAAGNTVNQ